ncbi:AraC family transcriptional regulator [Marinomonas algicola]|uniref:AraC family transcriptional regulator n=1 Tax=Marinomonas algicola TaxID=2773454 RepID=UPI00174811D7|nr:AraC family transcriptional regulator [Marinomonas algicola]
MKTTHQRQMPTPQDPLGETLYSLRLNGVMYAASELKAPWGMDMPPLKGNMMFHIITQGACWLRFLDYPDTYLQPGDIALLPRGEGHLISDEKKTQCEPFFDLPVTHISNRFESIQYGGGGEKTLLTCGVLSFDNVIGQKLIAQLPSLIHLKAEEGRTKALQGLIELMSEESKTLGAGGETIVANIADIVVIKAIRYWLDTAPEANKGWLGALKDPKIGKALTAMHAHPELDWTLDSLAAQVGMSRSGFSARFTDVIGTSAKQYLTEWRMGLARLRIMEAPVSLIELAEDLGYTSEAAFSRAYKRVFGVPPLRESRKKHQNNQDQLAS